ncbi:MAG: helix-turn-helix transcriptional regulator [Firmicutes bacterium]|nr:helix-turn-helix transcriptional regulator [Bacillota bacterium]
MKFGENLQKLRKERNISQEQLAEQIGVTRQSVSKWESNMSYPEMDKLIAICKIFNCDLDVLVNKDISEEKSKKDASSIIKNVFKEVLSYIEKTVRLFEQKSSKEIIKIIAQVFLIILVLLLFKIPFEVLNNTISNALYIENNYISIFFSRLCDFIFNSIYAILAIASFLYIFKIKFLDEYTTHEKEENNTIEKKEKVISKKIKETTTTDILVKLITIFVKLCLLLFLIPIVSTAIALIFWLVILIIFIFKGVFVVGPIICLTAGVVISILIIELVLDFILNLKINKKRTIITIISSLVIASIGIALSAWYFLNLNIINKVPKEFKTVTTKETISMDDNIKFYQNNTEIKYVEDSNLNDKVIVEITNYDLIKNVKLKQEDSAYMIEYDTDTIYTKRIINSILNNLKNDNLYVYEIVDNFKVTIKTSKQNIDKIKTNQERIVEEEIEE